MSEFIRAIEFDQTPNKVMMQFGSELAEQANKTAQMNASIEKMNADRQKALYEKYGEFQKMGIEQIKGVKGELVDKIMSRFVESLGQALNESKGDIGVFTRLGFDKSLKGLIADRAASDQILAMTEDFVKANEPLGIDGQAIRAAGNNYALNIGSKNPSPIKLPSATADSYISTPVAFIKSFKACFLVSMSACTVGAPLSNAERLLE